MAESADACQPVSKTTQCLACIWVTLGGHSLSLARPCNTIRPCLQLQLSTRRGFGSQDEYSPARAWCHAGRPRWAVPASQPRPPPRPVVRPGASPPPPLHTCAGRAEVSFCFSAFNYGFIVVRLPLHWHRFDTQLFSSRPSVKVQGQHQRCQSGHFAAKCPSCILDSPSDVYVCAAAVPAKGCDRRRGGCANECGVAGTAAATAAAVADPAACCCAAAVKAASAFCCACTSHNPRRWGERTGPMSAVNGSVATRPQGIDAGADSCHLLLHLREAAESLAFKARDVIPHRLAVCIHVRSLL